MKEKEVSSISSIPNANPRNPQQRCFSFWATQLTSRPRYNISIISLSNPSSFHHFRSCHSQHYQLGRDFTYPAPPPSLPNNDWPCLLIYPSVAIDGMASSDWLLATRLHDIIICSSSFLLSAEKP